MCNVAIHDTRETAMNIRAAGRSGQYMNCSTSLSRKGNVEPRTFQEAAECKFQSAMVEAPVSVGHDNDFHRKWINVLEHGRRTAEREKRAREDL